LPLRALRALHATAGVTAFECADGNPPEPWAVDAPFVCTATHIITQADIDFGSVSSDMR